MIFDFLHRVRAEDMAAQNLRHRVPYRVRGNRRVLAGALKPFFTGMRPPSSSERADALTEGSSLKTAFAREIAAN